jgi:hypothetical protein
MPELLPEVEQVPGGLYFMPDQTAQILAAEAGAAIERQIETAVANVKAGVYRCPWGCGTPGFTAEQWKTEAGFRKHLESCRERPTVESIREAQHVPKPPVVTTDAEWERRHAGQDFAASTEIGLEALTCIGCGEGLEYEVCDGLGNYFCPHCRDCVATGKGI